MGTADYCSKLLIQKTVNSFHLTKSDVRALNPKMMAMFDEMSNVRACLMRLIKKPLKTKQKMYAAKRT